MKHIKIVIIIMAVLSIATLKTFADEVRLIAHVDKTVLTTVDSLTLSITVKGAGTTPAPADLGLDDFSMIYGPNVSSHTTIVNGVVSVSKGFSYGLKPKSTGNFTIGPFSLNYQGKVYSSNKIDIQVVDRRGSAQSDETELKEKLFIEFTTDKSEVYTYEQIILTFKFFYQRGLPLTDIEYVEPEIRNFIKENMGQQSNYEIVKNGVIYNVIELNTALFPVVSGNLKIGPASLNCNIVVKSNKRRKRNDYFGNSFFDDFFGDQTKYAVTRSGNPIHIKIKPLPEEGKPDDFKGAIGDYSIKFDAKPVNVSVGDPITLTMQVKGKGNLQTISEPVLKLYEEKDFRVYPSEIKTKITGKKNGIKGYKIFNKVIEPQDTNITQTPAVSFTFFNPETEKYQTLLSSPIPVKVEAGEVEMPLRLYVREAELDKDSVSIITKDILPIMTNLAHFTNDKNGFYMNPILYAILFIPIVAVFASIFSQRHREKLKTDVSYARKRKAQTGAKKSLSEARKCMTDGSADEFYTTLSNAFTKYIADKLNTTPASIAPNTVGQLLKDKEVPSEKTDKVIQLLEQCDFGRFAKDSGTKEAINEALNNAEDLIDSLERYLK